TKKIFSNMRHYQGPDMPLLAHMLNQGEPAFVQDQQQEVSPPPPSPVVSPHPSPDLMPSPPRRIKKLESKLKTKKRKLVLSDSENKEEARQSQELEALLDLANAALHELSHSTTPSKLANPEQSSE
nr:hypothetical protein [Tanacetum cinerariifolium]